ncbi:regulatory protein RecX [Candidatus Gracilibacteria bacterium]|nr:MAG: regulatory protein RecX [Candidatus Gracilibacteria bacterium]
MGKSCYEYAIGIITKYPKTEKELRIKLYQQGYDSEMVLRTLEKLKSENFVNDLLFAESYLNSEVMKKGKPLFLIKKKLELKGIDKQLLNKLSDKYAEDIQEGILQGIQREIRNYKKRGTDGFEIIQKLMRKGYKLSDIKKVIKENTKENEEY